MPKYEGGEAAELEGLFKALEAEAAKAAGESAARITELEKELAEVAVAKEALATKTVDEELSSDPELAAKIDKEIADGNW